jgi:hypothetical protein
LEWQCSRLPNLANKHKALVASEDYSVGTTTNIEVNGTARRFAGNIDMYKREGDVEVVIHGNSSSWLSILQGDARNVDPFTFCATVKPYGQEISN